MKRLTVFFVAGLMFLFGIFVGQWSIEKQIHTRYEDGSFVGCYRGGQCDD